MKSKQVVKFSRELQSRAIWTTFGQGLRRLARLLNKNFVSVKDPLRLLSASPSNMAEIAFLIIKNQQKKYQNEIGNGGE